MKSLILYTYLFSFKIMGCANHFAIIQIQKILEIAVLNLEKMCNEIVAKKWQFPNRDWCTEGNLHAMVFECYCRVLYSILHQNPKIIDAPLDGGKVGAYNTTKEYGGIVGKHKCNHNKMWESSSLESRNHLCFFVWVIRPSNVSPLVL